MSAYRGRVDDRASAQCFAAVFLVVCFSIDGTGAGRALAEEAVVMPVENRIPSAETNYWGRFNGRETYLAECECGCGLVSVRYLDTDGFCSVQTLTVWARLTLEAYDPDYVLPAFGQPGQCEGRETRMERCVDIDCMCGRPLVKFTDDHSECRLQTIHARGADQGNPLPEDIPQWLQFFAWADSLLAQLEGRSDTLKAEVDIYGHEDPEAVYAYEIAADDLIDIMMSTIHFSITNVPGIWN